MLKKTALAHFKNQVALADAIQVSPQAVHKWGPVIPWGAALEIQRVTVGTLQRDESLYENRKPKPYVDPSAKE